MLVDEVVPDPMVAPGAVQRILSIVPVLVLVKVMQLSWQAVVAVPVNEATGVAVPVEAVIMMSSIPKAGSVPALLMPSVNWKPNSRKAWLSKAAR